MSLLRPAAKPVIIYTQILCGNDSSKCALCVKGSLRGPFDPTIQVRRTIDFVREIGVKPLLFDFIWLDMQLAGSWDYQKRGRGNIRSYNIMARHTAIVFF